MTTSYALHIVTASPRQWQSVANDVQKNGAALISTQGGSLYGVWRSQIGRPRDELTIITAWNSAGPAVEALLGDSSDIRDATHEVMTPTLRPETTDAPRR